MNSYKLFSILIGYCAVSCLASISILKNTVKLFYSQIKPVETHVLRQRILRPHQDLSEMIYPNDALEGAFHGGAFFEDQLIGVASIYPESQEGEITNQFWRIRGMAVEDKVQGKGIGRGLVSLCIEHARNNKGQWVWCNARTSAIGFYESLGFEKTGNEFLIEGIGPHYIAHIKI